MIEKANSTILLKLQLADRESDKFVRASLIRSDGAPFSGSPVVLTHQSSGLYTDQSLLMPLVDEVLVQYDIFNDVGLTSRSTDYPDTILQAIQLDEGASLVGALASLQAVLANQTLDLLSYVEAPEVISTVESDEFQSLVDGDSSYDLVSQIDLNEVTAFVDQDEIVSQVDDNEVISYADCEQQK